MTQTLSEQEINNKIAEAELYKGQGLVGEALNVCQQLLKTVEDESLRQTIQALAADIPEEGEGNLQSSAGSDATLETGDQQAQFESCQGLIAAGFHPEALEQLEILAKSNFNTAKVQAKMGECFLYLNNPFTAQEHMECALNSGRLDSSERLETLDRLALAYESTSSIPAAIKALEQIIKTDRTFRNASQRLNALTQTAQKAGRLCGLVQKELITIDDLEQAKERAKQKSKTIETILLDDFEVSRSAIGEALSDYYGCPYVEFSEEEAGSSPACIKDVKERFLRSNCFVPIHDEDGIIEVALDNPHDLVKVDNIKSTLKTGSLILTVALKEDIFKFIDCYFGKYNFTTEDEQGEGVFEQLDLELEKDSDDDPEELDSYQADGVVVQMTNKIIEDGILAGASDIHIESQVGTKGVHVRFRIDGDCQHYRNIPYNYKRSLVSRLKILSQLDISERRLPQDGKIKFKSRSGRKIELRVATLPTTGNNEDVVLRVLASSSAMPLDKAGILDHNLQRFKTVIEQPYGLVAVVGPTGSGKTTTLHAALHHVNKPEKKIWTAEDPVEIVQEGLRQVQVQNKIDLTFARILKAFLRADPDIIMVGETRDFETASTVIEASLTGHLVFTTLHTNSAPETITRLIGIGIDPFTFADALLGVLAQRLVKRLCPKCKKSYTPDSQEREGIMEAYGRHPNQPLDPERLEDIDLYNPAGCPVCKQSGYSGRLGIHELLTTNDDIRHLISQNKPVHEIREAAMQEGMLTLMQDGVLKALQGDTSINHARAACIK